MKPPRVALYGHDTVGLGHVRRNLALAGAISRTAEQPDVLVVSGAAEATAYDLPPRVDVVVVPGVRKDENGRYRSRRLGSGLDAVLALRRATIAAAIESFDPDLLIVDKVPYGFGAELRSLLPRLRHRGRNGERIRVVLGLRDVLDEPGVTRAEWRTMHANQALREDVDEVWVYGDEMVHDLAGTCGVPPALRQRFHYTGYLATGRIERGERPTCVDRRTPYALCTVGGGQDGTALAAAFARTTLPPGLTGVLVTGPQMDERDRAAVQRVAAGRRDLTMIDFSPKMDRWIAAAAAVVSMGGYNTVAEILSTTTPALIVPRTRPRAEQAVRADALSALGCIDQTDPATLDASVLSRWMDAAVVQTRRPRTAIDLDGLATVGRLASSLLDKEALRASAG